MRSTAKVLDCGWIFPLTVLLTVPDFMGGVLLLTTRRSRKNDAGGRKLPKISLRDTGRAQTDRHSVSCIVMQRAENVPDAFFRFTQGKTSLFVVFASESRSARFSGAHNKRLR